jgi:N-acetylneuraminic acid mutarotase
MKALSNKNIQNQTLNSTYKFILRKYDLRKTLTTYHTLFTLSIIALTFTYSAVQAAGQWTPTGSMHVGRLGFTATLLNSGKVLVTGGATKLWSDSLSSSELYDPETGQWTYTGSMNQVRTGHSATLLSTGEVMVAGGYEAGKSGLASAEIYNPETGKWRFTGSMNTPRAFPYMSPLRDGKVLITAGSTTGGSQDSLSSAEIFDPDTETWQSTGSMVRARTRYYLSSPSDTIQPLANGKILVVGGHACCGYIWFDDSELYDPSTKRWSRTTAKSTHAQGSTALLSDGRVLVAGGRYGFQGSDVTIADAEIYDPENGNWAATSSLPSDRLGPLVTLLNGKILMAGGGHEQWGSGRCGPMRPGALYDPKTGTWKETASLVNPRSQHIAIRLLSGKVLIAGGYDCVVSGSLASAELYTPEKALPPSASAIPISPSSIQLVWNKDASAKALRIQRKTGTCEAATAWATRMDLGSNKTTVEDTGLKANTAYAYRLAYYYGGKTFSEYSACVSATTNLARTPNMPKSLVARSDSDTQVTLTWSDLSTNERGFDVYRKDDVNDWTKLASTRANTPTYRDNTATGNATTTTYAYHVEACNTAGCSQMNPNVAVVPFKPTALQATPGTTVQLQWVDASSNESGFTILRKNGACGNALPWTTVATVGADKTTYGDTAVIGKTRYAYQVQAHTATAQPIARGYSANSECVSVVTP